MTDRKKPGMVFWATVVVVVALVGYPLSLFPLEWLSARDMLPDLLMARRAREMYRAPIEWVADNGPEWCEHVLDWLDTYAVLLE